MADPLLFSSLQMIFPYLLFRTMAPLSKKKMLISWLRRKARGKVWGLESFGFSAPYKVLDEKLGFTAENVYKQVKAML